MCAAQYKSLNQPTNLISLKRGAKDTWGYGGQIRPFLLFAFLRFLLSREIEKLVNPEIEKLISKNATSRNPFPVFFVLPSRFRVVAFVLSNFRIYVKVEGEREMATSVHHLRDIQTRVLKSMRYL